MVIVGCGNDAASDQVGSLEEEDKQSAGGLLSGSCEEWAQSADQTLGICVDGFMKLWIVVC